MATTTDRLELKKKALPLIRAVLTAKAKVGIPLHMLCGEFEETCMEPLKFREMGYGTLQGLLEDCGDICTVTRASAGYLVVKGIASKEDAHIYKLVSGQRKDRKKKPKRVILSVKRRASHFTGGKTPNFKPSLRYNHFLPTPQHSFIGDVRQRPFASTVYPTNNYTQLRQAPFTRFSTYGDKNIELAPRFLKSRKNNNNNLFTNNSHSQITIYQNNAPADIKTTHSETQPSKMFNKDGTKSDLSSHGLASLEKKLRDLLLSKKNGLWATRLRPEFKTMYGDSLPEDIRQIIQQSFLSFITIDSPMPNMEILYFKEGKKIDRSLPPETKQQIGVDIQNNKNNSLSNGHHTNHSHHANGNDGSPSDSLPDVICISPPLNLKSSSVPSSKYVKQKSLSPNKSDFKIELPDLPNVGDEIKVFVCHVESLDRFFVQFADSAVEDLVYNMQLYYEDPNNSKDIGKPRLDEYCCARYSKDKLWFRSKILSVKEQKNILNESYRCRVIYVDYGNDEYVISTELKYLTEEFCKLPFQAIQCNLHNISPLREATNWSEKVIEKFKEITDTVELTMTVKQKNGSVLSIDLIDCNGQSVCAYLCDSKFATQAVHSSYIDGIISPEISTESTSPVTPLSPTKLVNENDSENVVSLPPSLREIKPKCVVVPADQDYIDISVSHINSTTDIAIIMIGPQYNEQLDRLEEMMNKYYEKDTILPAASLEVGNYYAASYEEDWVRVELISMNDAEFEVLRLDHGDKTIVSKEEIKDLSMAFWKPPFQAISCSLANVPESFDPEILQFLTENTHLKPLIGYIIERPTGPGMKMSIELYDTSNEADDININNEIIEKIEKEKNLCPTLPEVGGGHCNAYIAHISLRGEVYIQILGPGTERLEILMEDMTSHFTQTRASEIMQRPVVGNLCCAKFYDDGAWYRAKITKVMHKERKVEVEFIDYGNHEVIQMVFIRNPNAVNEKVLSLPVQAVKCHIAGYSELNLNEETHKKMREFAQSLDAIYVSVIENDGTLPVVRILIPPEEEDEDPIDFIERYKSEQLQLMHQSVEDSCEQLSLTDTSSVFEGTTFQSIANIDNTSFEDISIVGEESYCKINPLRSNDSNALLSEYDVISNVHIAKETEIRSESPAVAFSTDWGIPKMMITERVIEGVILNSHDPYKFSFIPFTLWEDLEKLHVEMMKAYTYTTSDHVTFKVNDVVAVFHHLHEIWYRAVIIAEVDDEVVVKYPDFSGTAEVEATKNIRRLQPQFKHLPFLAVRCSLAGIEPTGGLKNWDSQTASLFNEMVMNNNFQVEITTRVCNNNLSKPLEVRLHGGTDEGVPFVVNDKLVKMGFARRVR